MTRGREANIAHLVADAIEEARAIWEITFSRDWADLGPAHAREVALDDIDRYGTQPLPMPHQPSLPALPGRPLEEVLADLRTAWTQQADLHERCNRLVGLRDRLEHVAAIHAHYNSQPRDLSQREHAARQRWLQADRRCKELDRTIADERLRLLQGSWTAWRGDQPILPSAAATIQDGAGLLGQRRRLVHDVRDTLTALADKWREVVPSLPSDPDQIIDQFCGGLMWLDSQPIRDAIDVPSNGSSHKLTPTSTTSTPRPRRPMKHSMEPRPQAVHSTGTSTGQPPRTADPACPYGRRSRTSGSRGDGSGRSHPGAVR